MEEQSQQPTMEQDSDATDATDDVHADAISPTLDPTEQLPNGHVETVSQSRHMNTWYTNKGLHVSHLNIHFLYPKLDEIKILLNLQENIDIFCLSETFLTDEFSNFELNIPNYDFIRKDRGSHGGGLIIYTKSDISCIHREDLEVDGIEMLWLEVRNNKQKPILLCYVYRPPSATIEWTETVEYSVEKANSETKEILFLGDVNFNLLCQTSSVKSWIKKTENLNLTQLVQTPTRVTDTSETLIDHVYSNTPENIVSVTVPQYSISDHYPVCVTRKVSKSFSRGPVHKFICYRDTKSFNESDFIHELENQPWSIMNIFEDASDALDYFTNLFTSVLDKHAPKKKRRVKRQKQPNWMNPEISSAMKTRDYQKNKDTTQYKVLRNQVKSKIHNSKTDYYAKTINNNHSNPKQLWQNLHDITNKSTKQHASYINDQNGKLILDPEEMANNFNNFFTSIHEQLTQNNGRPAPDLSKLETFVNNKLPSDTSFKIPHVTSSFILNQLQNLKVSKATGIDELSARYLKLSAAVISAPLAKVLNLSIDTGSYPDDLKRAKVTPIFKKGEKTDINNYRPISVLPIITGIFERHVSNCLVNFLEEHNLIYEQQSGFRKQHSCQTALTKIVDNWLTAINNNEIVGTLFLDLTKAFDLVNHQILLQKLALYKFSPSTLSWFASYLSNRTQQVNISGKLSSTKEILAGVPQGSVLGPLLFILFVNDLPQYIKYCLLELFADDATLHISDTSIPSLCQYLNADFLNFLQWCEDNDMKANIPKTKAMFISSKHAAGKISAEAPVLQVGQEQIQISEHEKLLGVHLDNTLSWTSHVEAIVKKCNTLLFLLNRIKQYLSIPIRKLFFNAYILPHLDYCCTIWGNANSELMNTVTKFQKRAARSILDKPIDTPSAELFAQLNWMTFPERVDYQKAVLMYKTMHGLTPPYLHSLFQFTSEIHTRSLRSTSEDLLYIPKPKLEIYRNTIAYSGSKLWNAIPENIRQCTSLHQFKHRYLQWVEGQS